jgi:hypothetical protein
MYLRPEQHPTLHIFDPLTGEFAEIPNVPDKYGINPEGSLMEVGEDGRLCLIAPAYLWEVTLERLQDCLYDTFVLQVGKGMVEEAREAKEADES